MTEEQLSREQKSGFRLAFLVTAVHFLFWLIYYFVAGSVPVVREIYFFSIKTPLLFGVSRWWDLFLTPLLVSSMGVIYFASGFSPKEEKEVPDEIGFTSGAIFLLFFAAGVLLLFGLAGPSYQFYTSYIPEAIIVLGCLIIFISSFVFWAGGSQRAIDKGKQMIRVALTAPLVASLIVSLIYGIPYSFGITIMAFSCYLTVLLVSAPLALICKGASALFTKKFWNSTWTTLDSWICVKSE